MTLFLISLALFLIVFLAMGIGYVFQQKSLAGSCGGIAALGIDKACNCDNPCEKRKERERVAAEQVESKPIPDNVINIKNI